MLSKKSYFNSGIYRSTLKRFWPLWAAYAFVLFILLPLTIIGNEDAEYFQVSGQILQSGWRAGAIISFVMAAVTSMCVFGFLYTPRHCGLITSLPISREAVFVSAFCAGLSAMLAADVLIVLITIVAEAQIGLLAIGYLWKWLAVLVMMNITFFGFAAFCAMLTGNIIVMPAVYGVLSITAVGFEYLVKSLLLTFIYGMSEGSSMFSVLSPFVELLNNSPYVSYADYTAGQAVTTAAISAEQWIMLGIYCASGIVFAFLGLLIYRQRRMETSTDVVAIKILKPVFKYCMTVGCALVMGVWLFAIIFGDSYQRTAAFIVIGFMLVGAFIGYFAAEMLMKKTFKVFSGSWKGLGIACCAIVILMLCFSYDLFGYEKRLPEAGDVECVTILADGDSATLKAPENIAQAIALQQMAIDSKEENIANESGFINLRIDYALKGDKTLARSYRIPCDDEHSNDPNSEISAVEALLNVQEAVDSRKQTAVEVNEKNISYASINYFDIERGEYINYDLTPQQAVELYTSCIVPDIKDGALGRIWLNSNGDYYAKVYALDISIELYDRTNNPVTDAEDFEGSDYDYFQTTLTVDAARTLQWLAQNTDVKPVMLSKVQQYSSEANGYVNETVEADHTKY